MGEKKRRDLLKKIGIEKKESELIKYDWLQISTYKLSEEFIREFQEQLNWGVLSQYRKMSESFIREFENKVDWVFILNKCQASESFIREFQSKVNWFVISRTYNLSDNFIEEFKDKIHWKIYFQVNYVGYDIMKKYIFKTNIKHSDEFETSHLSEKQKCEIDKLLKLKQIF